ncbi:hypothetical protein ACFL6U_20530 [Planctomycetota bacterium]
MPWKKSGLRIGGQAATADSSVTLGINNLGVNVDLEEALGADTSTTSAYVYAFFRNSKNPKHRYDLSWYSLKRSSSKTIGQDITIGDTTFPLGTTINSHLDMDIIKSSYSYSFIQDDRVDLALSAGLYILPIRFGIEASGAFQGNEGESITAPLPVFGFRGDIALAPKWILHQRAQLFYLEYGAFKGGISDLGIGVEWRPLKNVGLGVDLTSFMMRVHAEGGDYPGVDFVGDLRLRTVGLMLYGSVFH